MNAGSPIRNRRSGQTRLVVSNSILFSAQKHTIDFAKYCLHHWIGGFTRTLSPTNLTTTNLAAKSLTLVYQAKVRRINERLGDRLKYRHNCTRLTERKFRLCNCQCVLETRPLCNLALCVGNQSSKKSELHLFFEFSLHSCHCFPI